MIKVNMNEIEAMSLTELKNVLRQFLEKENARLEKMRKAHAKYRKSEKGRKKMRELQKKHYQKSKNPQKN